MNLFQSTFPWWWHPVITMEVDVAYCLCMVSLWMESRDLTLWGICFAYPFPLLRKCMWFTVGVCYVTLPGCSRPFSCSVPGSLALFICCHFLRFMSRVVLTCRFWPAIKFVSPVYSHPPAFSTRPRPILDCWNCICEIKYCHVKLASVPLIN